MSDRIWTLSTPPFVAWWNASVDCDPIYWRWWDGKVWSYPVTPSASAAHAAMMARRKAQIGGIYWSDYYPPNARVPRIAP